MTVVFDCITRMGSHPLGSQGYYELHRNTMRKLLQSRDNLSEETGDDQQREDDIHFPPDLLSSSSDNSVSSLSSFGSISDCNDGREEGANFSESPPRTIFKRYWDKTGDSPQLPLRTCTQALSEPVRHSLLLTGDEEISFVNSYERTLNRNEQVKPRTMRRRSIFGDCLAASRANQSMPMLGGHHNPPLYRKANSTSRLEQKRLPSCLRSRKQLSSSGASVSFDLQVSIHEFALPKETWAAGGWSKWFA